MAKAFLSNDALTCVLIASDAKIFCFCLYSSHVEKMMHAVVILAHCKNMFCALLFLCDTTRGKSLPNNLLPSLKPYMDTHECQISGLHALSSEKQKGCD
jgi:hypothetical protein